MNVPELEELIKLTSQREKHIVQKRLDFEVQEHKRKNLEWRNKMGLDKVPQAYKGGNGMTMVGEDN